MNFHYRKDYARKEIACGAAGLLEVGSSFSHCIIARKAIAEKSEDWEITLFGYTLLAIFFCKRAREGEAGALRQL